MRIWVVNWEDATVAFSTKEKANTYLQHKLQNMKVEARMWDESDEDCEVYSLYSLDYDECIGEVCLQVCIIDEMVED